MKKHFLFLTVVLSTAAVSFLLSCQNLQTDKKDSPLGILAHVGADTAQMQLMYDAGMRWVRTDIEWSHVERPEGTWNFSDLDAKIDLEISTGLNPLGILLYDVPWAHPAYEHLDKWLGFVEKAVSRFKDRVKYWEVWNEPNLLRFWDNPDGADYATLLKATYSKIKEIDPEATVVYAGVCGIPLEFIEQSFKAGATDSFDRLAFHPYRGKFSSMAKIQAYHDEIADLKALMDRYGVGDRGLWITEMGVSDYSVLDASTVAQLVEIKRQKSPDRVWKLALLRDIDASPEQISETEAAAKLFDGVKDITVETVNLTLSDLETVDVTPYDAVLCPSLDNYPPRLFETISPSLGYYYIADRIYFLGDKITALDQADYLPQSILMSLRFGVEKFFWYEFAGSENNPFAREAHFNIVRRGSLELKPAYIAYSTLGRLFPEGSVVDTKTEWNRGDFCAISWIQPDRTRVWALWSPDGARTVSVKSLKGLRQAVGCLGEPLPITAATTELELSPAIIYLVGPKQVL